MQPYNNESESAPLAPAAPFSPPVQYAQPQPPQPYMPAAGPTYVVPGQPQPQPLYAQMMQVTCRVCSNVTPYNPQVNTSVVKCPRCNEATQVGPPPLGKQYIICQCNALLTARVGASDVLCPRPHCKRLIILGPPAPGKKRGRCPHCTTLMTYRASAGIIRCPKCRRTCTANRQRAVINAMILFVIGLAFLGLGIGLILSSLEFGSIIFLPYGTLTIGVVEIVLGIVYSILAFVMKPVQEFDV